MTGLPEQGVTIVRHGHIQAVPWAEHVTLCQQENRAFDPMRFWSGVLTRVSMTSATWWSAKWRVMSLMAIMACQPDTLYRLCKYEWHMNRPCSMLAEKR